MAAGDLITRDGQYEFNGLLLNNGDWLQVESAEGLFDLPNVKSVGDSEMDDDHGGKLGHDLLTMKDIVLALGVWAETEAALHLRQRAVANVFQPRDDLLPFVYQKAGIGKMYIPVRPRKFSGFKTSYVGAKTKINRAATLLLAPDPRILGFLENSQIIQIADGASQAQDDISMLGNFRRGAWPILEIAGPATNPRITNVAANRTIRIDHVIAAGQTMVVDVKARTVTIDGVDHFASVRNDNQWWVLYPGVQAVSWTRSNTPANTADLTVRWRDSWAA